MITFEKLRYKNFLSTGNTFTVIDLARSPSTLVVGANGSGKSTLASVLAGRNEYDVTRGEILYEGVNLLEMSPENRARAGIFL